MSSPKLITVFGATGAQGGSVIQSLLQNKSGDFKIRGITRNPNSDAAKALAAVGVEVVKADGLKKDEMAAAFRGSWGAFVNTNSDDPALDQPNGPTETDLGKIIVDAAASAGVQHFVYSGMASATEITKGAVPARAFDEKHAIGQHARTKPFATVIDVSPGWYMENWHIKEMAPLFGGFPHEPDEEGYLTFRSPRWGGNDEVPFIAMTEDYGDLVHGVFLNPEKYNGRLIHGLSESKPIQDVTTTFEKVTGRKARFEPMEDWNTFEAYGIKPMETVKRMFGFCLSSGGLYYGEPNNPETAAGLKKAASLAQGKSEAEGRLMTVEEFFKKYYSS